MGRLLFEQPKRVGVEPDLPVEPARRYVRIAELASYTSLSPRHIHDLTRRGEIPHVRVGGVVLYDLRRIDAWLETLACGPAPRRFEQASFEARPATKARRAGR